MITNIIINVPCCTLQGEMSFETDQLIEGGVKEGLFNGTSLFNAQWTLACVIVQHGFFIL